MLWGPAAGVSGAAVPTNGVEDFWQVVSTNLEHIGVSLRKFVTPLGIRELLQCFCSLLPLVLVGMYLNVRKKLASVPLALHLIFPISLLYALLSTHLGRMMFAAFPLLVVYALIPFKWVFDGDPGGRVKTEHESIEVPR